MMSSSQFVFLDLSEIGEEDFEQLADILDEKKCDLCLPAVAVASGENLKEVGDSSAEESTKSMEDEEDEYDVLSQSRKNSLTSGYTFFVDGGLPDDIELGKTPPMLSASTTPPPSETPSTPCNEPEDLPPEELVAMYPPHPLQPPYMNPAMPMMHSMNMHTVPTSGPVYSMAPPTAVQNGLYPHMAPNPPHHHHHHMQPNPPHHPHHLVPHTVHIENCHVNLSPYGNPPQPSHGPLYAHAPPYQGPPHHQVFHQPYVLGDQLSMMHMKGGLDRDYEPKRHESHGRGGGYSRVRGRGGRGRRKGRDDSERSNSVSSDHSSYSDSGGKPHYKDPCPPPPTHVGPAHFPPPLLPYPPYVPYVNSLSRPQQGFPILPQGFLPDPYGPPQTPHVLAYPAHHPVSVPMMAPEGPSSPSAPPPQTECDPPVGIPQGQIQEHITVQVTSITTHASYMEAPTTSHASHIHPQTHYPYSAPTTTFVHTESTPMAVANVDSLPLELLPSVSSLDPPPEDDQVLEVPSQKLEEEAIIPLVQCDVDPSVPKPPSYCVPGEYFIAMATDEAENAPQVEESAESSNAREPPVIQSSLVEESLCPAPQVPTPPVSQSYQHQPVAEALESAAPPSSREGSPPSVSSNNKYSPVPFSAAKGSEKDVVVTKPAKVQKKNSNKDAASASTSSSTASSSRNSPNMSFEAHNSITIYNKSLASLPPAKDIGSKAPKGTTETKAKVENGFTVERQPHTVPPPAPLPQPHTVPTPAPLPQPPTEPPREKKLTSFVAKETALSSQTQPIVPTQTLSDPDPKNDIVEESPPLQVPSSSKPAGNLVWGQKKSWSQLFKTADDVSTKQVAFVSPFNAKEGSDASSLKSNSKKENGEMPSSNGDVEKAKLGALLKDYRPNYRPVLLQPRGLINKNYWCYVNAPLQALLASPSFYQLAETLSNEAGYKSGNVSTPFINSFVDFVSEFTLMGPIPKTSRKKDAAAHKKEPEVSSGVPFEPTCVYKMLINCKENQFTEGRQQDAEEMLSCVLNGLHDEMVESVKLAGPSNSPQNGVAAGENGASDQGLAADEDEWKVQGPKRKSCVTRTAHYHPSPISEIFWGQLRSVLHQAGNMTANLQPFNTLPLDIQSSKVDTLKDALSQLVTREEISGFTCPKTNQEVTASNQVLFEELPRVLILQLKRFIYDKDGGLQKVTKRLQFPIDLDITKDLISTNSRSKFSASQRKFKLFAIVNHEGKEATKGHYVADVYHNGYACWLRYDDSNVKPIPEGVVLRHEPPRVPYLLFYRRSDTLSAPAVSSGGAAATPSSQSNGKVPAKE